MKKILILFILMISVSTLVSAQTLRGLMNRAVNSATNKAGEKVGEEVENQVDKQVSKFFDNLIKEDTTKTKETTETDTQSGETDTESKENMPQSQKSMSNFMSSFGAGTNVKKKDLYRFTAQIASVMESTDANGAKTDPVDYIISYNDENSDIHFSFSANKGQQSSIIIDNENKVSLILTNENGKKSGIATSIEVDESSSAGTSSSGQEKADEKEDCYVKTGKNRSISGYSCTEYRCETSEEINSVWATNDLNRKYNSVFSRSPMGGKYKGGKIDGMVIEWSYQSKTDKSSSKMTVKSFDPKKASSFSTEGYEIMSFSMKVN